MAAHAETIKKNEHGEHSGHGGHHVSSVLEFVVVFVALLGLLVITVGAAILDVSQIVPIPGINIYIMLAIAIVKAAIVVLFFMEVRKGTKLTWLWASLGFIWFLTMFQVFMDYWTRSWSVRGW